MCDVSSQVPFSRHAAACKETIIMATATTVSEQEYRELALNDPNHNWELWDGVPVEKPLMNMKHNDVAFLLGYLLQSQLDRGAFRVNVNGDRARISSRAYYVPDVMVIPAGYQKVLKDDPRVLGAYAEPLPLVAEVWSPSTSHYDIAVKLQGYRAREDQEIWFVQPYERTLTTWHRQLDGGYAEELYRGGIVPVASLPGVSIDLDALLDG